MSAQGSDLNKSGRTGQEGLKRGHTGPDWVEAHRARTGGGGIKTAIADEIVSVLNFTKRHCGVEKGEYERI